MAKQQTKIDTTKYKKQDKQSVLKSGKQVSTSKIDSVRKANPNMGRAIGKPYKGSGGMDSYGDDASDKIKSAIKRK